MNNKLMPIENIQNRIFSYRELQVMIDRDLAEMYDVEVKRLNEQVKRNIERFPVEFRFQLNDTEKDELVANCDRFEKLNIHPSILMLLLSKVFQCFHLFSEVKQQ